MCSNVPVSLHMQKSIWRAVDKATAPLYHCKWKLDGRGVRWAIFQPNCNAAAARAVCQWQKVILPGPYCSIRHYSRLWGSSHYHSVNVLPLLPGCQHWTLTCSGWGLIAAFHFFFSVFKPAVSLFTLYFIQLHFQVDVTVVNMSVNAT